MTGNGKLNLILDARLTARKGAKMRWALCTFLVVAMGYPRGGEGEEG